jgi:pantoate--beta-alanine ligase
MEFVEKKAHMRRIVEEAKAAGLVVGVVPTMGCFHEGHLDLMRRARSECDVVVVTLFVNPTQFGAGEDLAAYPRDLERDSRMASSVGVDYIFLPDASEMYPEAFATRVGVEGLSDIMCGASREGHFGGVATVVAKLFNIVPAQRAYFGQKDAQQLVIIRKMAEDLDFAVEVVPVATRREDDGLAMSSRNTYLTRGERAQAVALNLALERAGELLAGGERRAGNVMAAMEEVVNAYPLVNLEYISICDNILLRPLEELSGGVLIALAARVGKARLIDNMVFEIE